MDTVILRPPTVEYYRAPPGARMRTVGNSVEKNRVTMHVLERHDLKRPMPGLDSYRALFEIFTSRHEKKWCVIPRRRPDHRPRRLFQRSTTLQMAAPHGRSKLSRTRGRATAGRAGLTPDRLP